MLKSLLVHAPLIVLLLSSPAFATNPTVRQLQDQMISDRDRY